MSEQEKLQKLRAQIAKLYRQGLEQKLGSENSQLLENLSDGNDVDFAFAASSVLAHLALVDHELHPNEESYLRHQFINAFQIGEREFEDVLSRARQMFHAFRDPFGALSMIVDKLPEAQKKELVDLVQGLIRADEVEAPHEIQFLNKLKTVLKVSAE